MALQYRNRRGDVYQLQSGRTSTGKPKYYFGKKLTGTPVDAIPDGYEIHESPERAQVYLRKVVPSAIARMEREIVTDGIHRLAATDHFCVEVERDSLVVYVADRQVHEVDEFIGKLAGSLLSTRMHGVRDEVMRSASYVKMLRFELVDESRRLFHVHRWCFRGAIDDWIFLRSGELSELVEAFAEHLGAESFFELM